MPPKRRYSRRRYSARRGRRTTRFLTKATFKRWQKKNIELKYYDYELDSTVDYSGSVFATSLVPQGDGDTTRDGDKICCKALKIHGIIAAADTWNYVRLIVFVWKPSAVANPSTGQILVDTGAADAPQSFYVHDYRKNFTVLWDKTFRVAVSQPNLTIGFKKYIRLKDLNINFITAGTSGQNHIYVMAISDSSAVSHPTVLYKSRLMFTDA